MGGVPTPGVSVAVGSGIVGVTTGTSLLVGIDSVEDGGVGCGEGTGGGVVGTTGGTVGCGPTGPDRGTVPDGGLD